MFKLVLLSSLTLILAACEAPNPTPETLDPLYADLSKRLGEAESDVASAKQDLADAQKQLDSAEPQTGTRKRAIDAIANANAKITQAEQLRQYLELKKAERLKYDHKSYLQAYGEKKPWPDPDEFKRYQAQRRLETAERNWGKRVPRLNSGKPGPEVKKEAPGEGGGEHE